MVKYSVVLIFLALISGCGKRAKNSDSSGTPRKPSTEIPAPTRFILSQEAYCSDSFECPEAIAKLVVVDRGITRYCTGSLIASNRMITAASCLPRSLQVKDLDCTSSIYAIFPKTLFFAEELARCKKIIYSDFHEEADPALWHQDIAVIELVKPSLRTPFVISAEGIFEEVRLESYQMSYVTEYKGVLAKKNCNPIYHSYANPFSTRVDSPMITMGDCYLKEGNQGAPLLNPRGELVGLLASNLDQNVSQYIQHSHLLGEKMSGISHASNFACSTEELNPGIRSKECDKVLSVPLLDELRYKLLQNKALHEKRMKSVLDELENAKKYFKYDYFFAYDYDKDHYEVSMKKPKCFFDIDKWIGEFTRWGGRIRTYGVLHYEIPRFRFKTKLDKYLRPYSEKTFITNKSFKIEFNPRDAYRYGNTYVSVSETNELGEFLPRVDYSQVTGECLL